MRDDHQKWQDDGLAAIRAAGITYGKFKARLFPVLTGDIEGVPEDFWVMQYEMYAQYHGASVADGETDLLPVEDWAKMHFENFKRPSNTIELKREI